MINQKSKIFDKLRFPIIKKPLPESKTLSMDDYLRFVSFNIKYTLDKKAYREWKKDSAVNAAFVLKTKRKDKITGGVV